MAEWVIPESQQIRAVNRPIVKKNTTVPVKPTDPNGGLPSGGSGGSGGGGGYDPYAAAQAQAAAAAAKAKADANAATKSLVDQQHGLLSGFAKQRDTKLANITRALTDADKALLDTYGKTLQGLLGLVADNDAAEADSSFANIANAIRERGDILEQVASQGAGETDQFRAQMQALRNYDANQNETNRSFFDTLRANNRAITGLNTDVTTSRQNLYSQAEADREQAYANYYNQTADTWTQIANIENANQGNDYQKQYANAGDEAAKATGSSYKRRNLDPALKSWAGMGKEQDRALSSNRAGTVTLGPVKRAEGSTLRQW